MTFTDPTPPTADDNSPAAVLARTRQAYTDTAKRITQLTFERDRAITENKAANEKHKKEVTELNAELTAAKAAHQQWGRLLPRGDTARGNGTQ